VYFETKAAPSQWELLNDGTCERSSSKLEHATLFDSEDACRAASTRTGWRCVYLTPPNSQSLADAAYCVPDSTAAGNYSSVGSCEAACTPAPPSPPAPPVRGSCCWNMLSCNQATTSFCPLVTQTQQDCAASEDACQRCVTSAYIPMWCPVPVSPPPAPSPPPFQPMTAPEAGSLPTWAVPTIAGVAGVLVVGGFLCLCRRNCQLSSGGCWDVPAPPQKASLGDAFLSPGPQSEEAGAPGGA